MSRKPKPSAAGAAEDIHVYEYSGIEERHGTVPAWLWVVIVSLLIWMVYYLVRYWAPAK